MFALRIMSRGACLLAAFLILVALASAQEINVAIGVGARPAPKTLFDEIEDARERRAFRELWDAAPQTQTSLAARFAEDYPSSIVLRETYEVAARAHVAAGDLPQGLVWARRSLRLLPENPFLLVMVADISAKLGDLDLAAESARDALRYLDHAEPPAQLSGSRWPVLRDEMRATALFVQGRVAAHREQYKQAEQSLLASLTLNPNDMEALYTIGVVRMAVRSDEGAARAFSRVAQAEGSLAAAARESLRVLHARGPQAGSSFDAWQAALKWNPPEPAVPVNRPAEPARYAGSLACRDCHARVYTSWQSTGMARMFRDYRDADIIGDFSGAQTVAAHARAVRDGERHFIEIRRGDNNAWVRYPVDYVIGSKWQQAYATRLPDARLLVFPIQYSRLRSAWHVVPQRPRSAFAGCRPIDTLRCARSAMRSQPYTMRSPGAPSTIRNQANLTGRIRSSFRRRFHARRSIATAATARRRSSAKRLRARSVFAKATRRVARATIHIPRMHRRIRTL